jgi:fermentation-respiration switch protein FrsA (DUF1100 family)
MKNKKRLIKIVVGILVVVVAVLAGGGYYFFHTAEIRAPKSFISGETIKKTNPVYPLREKFLAAKKETWEITTPDKLKLVAWYVPAEKQTNKTVVIAHGFAGNKEKMAEYAQVFRDLGYNVLVPDDRAHGKSEGKYIGFGWLDRKDYAQWINKVVAQNKNSEILMFGLSMGGATTMMTSGEKLPNNVKAFIEDCGYDTVWNEITYQAKDMYHLPAFPFVYEVSALSSALAGYNYFEASSVDQLAKNKKPMLFIHGDKDDFVPTEMVYKNYKATNGPKEMLIVKGAKHAKSLETNSKQYIAKVKEFCDKYFA